jgi:hypothetical protein
MAHKEPFKNEASGLGYTVQFAVPTASQNLQY